jgi:hypothetical protein
MINDYYRRIEAITHLRAAIMHAECAMSIDSDSWYFDETSKCRKGRDILRTLIESLDRLDSSGDLHLK